MADTSPAEQLYVQGKRLASSGDYTAACALFEESQRIEPAIGTQFNLADCYEHTHRPVSALAMYREVARIAQMSAKVDRRRAAEERIDAIEKSAPRIMVTVETPSSEILIEQDGVKMSASELASGVLVDPGEHLIRGSAPGHHTWEARVRVTEGAPPVVVHVPALAPLPPRPPPPLRPTGVSPFKVTAIGLGSVGLATVTVGSVFGVTALSRTADAGCDGVDCRRSTAEGATSLRDAQTAGTTSTVLFAIGIPLLVGSVVLWLSAPRSSASHVAVPSGPTAAPPRVRASSLALEQTW